MQRTILHVDMDAFFAAVEQRDRPELRGRPVVVGGPPDKRGVVAAVSYEARVFGIRSAMPSAEAARRCPAAVFLPPDFARYRQASRAVFAVFDRYTPLVEPLSVDEAFLDVTGSRRLLGTGPEIARRIKADVRRETGLTASVGVATNKFLAKLASELEKPDGLTLVPEGRAAIAAFLAPLTVDRIWGVGRVTADALRARGVRLIGDLQRMNEEQLAPVVGRHGARHLIRLAWGEDERDIETEREEKSMSRETTFEQDVTDPARLETVLCDLADDVGARLRAAGVFATVAHLKLRWQGFETITRQRRLMPPACDDFSLREAALALFRAETLVKPVRLIGFGASGLTPVRSEQLDLFAADGGRERKEALSRTVDRIRGRFGPDAIRRGASRPGSIGGPSR